MYSALDIAKYFIHCANLEQEGLVTNLKLQKLLYYAQGFHLAVFDKPLFSEDVQAWAYGPVVPDVYQEYKSHGRDPLPDAKDFSDEILGEDTRVLVDEVYSVFGKYTATALANATHQELPWIHTERNEVIEHDLMKSYFKTRLV